LPSFDGKIWHRLKDRRRLIGDVPVKLNRGSVLHCGYGFIRE